MEGRWPVEDRGIAGPGPLEELSIVGLVEVEVVRVGESLEFVFSGMVVFLLLLLRVLFVDDLGIVDFVVLLFGLLLRLEPTSGVVVVAVVVEVVVEGTVLGLLLLLLLEFKVFFVLFFALLLLLVVLLVELVLVMLAATLVDAALTSSVVGLVLEEVVEVVITL